LPSPLPCFCKNIKPSKTWFDPVRISTGPIASDVPGIKVTFSFDRPPGRLAQLAGPFSFFFFCLVPPVPVNALCHVGVAETFKLVQLVPRSSFAPPLEISLPVRCPSHPLMSIPSTIRSSYERFGGARGTAAGVSVWVNRLGYLIHWCPGGWILEVSTSAVGLSTTFKLLWLVFSCACEEGLVNALF